MYHRREVGRNMKPWKDLEGGLYTWTVAWGKGLHGTRWVSER